MHPKLRVQTVVALFLLVVAALSVASTTAGTTRVPAKPVIGEPVTVPAQPQAGKRFTVSFRVTRSDTGKSLKRGKMVCVPSVAGKVIPHAESLRQGTARLSFVVPTDAAGRLLKVKLTIKAGSQSATKVATFRILQDEATPLVSISDASVVEGNAGITTLSFVVTLSLTSAKSVSVDFATADGTATAPTDYKSVSGTLSFKPGERAQTVAVSVIGDTTLEQDETLTVTLSNPINVTIANATATGTITNDDVAPQPLQVLLGTYCGFTTAGGGICFDVAATGTTQYVTHVKYKQTTKNCTPQRKFTLTVTWNGRAPIGPDLRFSYVDTSGGDGEIGSSTQGQFDTNGNAQGSLAMKKTFINQGTQYTCQSTSDWSAKKQG